MNPPATRPSEAPAMRMPRFRLTVRGMMVAVAVIAVLLVVEPTWIRHARHLVSLYGGGKGHMQADLVLAWAIPHGVIALIFVPVAIQKSRNSTGQPSKPVRRDDPP